MSHDIDDFIAADLDELTQSARRRRAHLDHSLAQRLYGRMRRRPVLLHRPLPAGIRCLIADWLQRDQLAMGTLVCADRGSRRLSARVWVVPTGWPGAMLPMAMLGMDGLQPVKLTVLWPAPVRPKSDVLHQVAA